MAIAKIKTRRMEFTPASIIQLAVAAVLVVVSFILIAVSISRWRLKMAFSEALYDYDSNRTGLVAEECKSALQRDKEFHYARELLAKVLTDAGKLEDAEAEYKQLLDLGYKQATVHCGLGVIALKKADKLDDAAAIKALVDAARQSFAAAKAADSNCPEALIGLAHADLLQGLKTNNSALLDSARKQFREIMGLFKSRGDLREKVSRDGLVDFYAGLGKASSLNNQYSDEAANAFKACFQYAPKWVLPLINRVSMDAQRFDESKFTVQELKQMEADIRQVSSDISTLWSASATIYGDLRDPWLQREISLAYAYARAGLIDPGYQQIVYPLKTGSTFSQRIEPYQLTVYVQTFLVALSGSPGDKEVQVTVALNSTEQLLGLSAMNEEKNPDIDVKKLKLAARNNVAALETWLADYSPNNQLSGEKGLNHFKDLADQNPNDPIVNRNYAIVLKRRGKPPAEIQPYLDKAKSVRDYAEVEKYVQGQ